MDLENFPTSESAKRMLESVDSGGFYDKSYVGNGFSKLWAWK